MLIAIDTSTRTAGLALYDGAQVVAETSWTSHDYHTVELAPLLEQAMQRSGVRREDLQAVGVALGPGSFTGLRIGLAVAKGLALGRHIPLIGVPTLDFLAASQPLQPEMPLLAILQAGRGRLAVGVYEVRDERWQRQPGIELEITEIEALSQRIHKPTLVCGELSVEERRILARKRKNVLLASPAAALRRPGFLAELAWQRWQAGQVDNPLTLAPIYLHIGEPIPG